MNATIHSLLSYEIVLTEDIEDIYDELLPIKDQPDENRLVKAAKSELKF